MKPSLLLLLALSSAFASCNSVRDIALRVSGDEGQNARTKGKGRVVYVRAYPLVGERSKAAFEKADFGQLWVDEPKVDQMVLNGDIVPFAVMPSEGGGDANAVDLLADDERKRKIEERRLRREAKANEPASPLERLENFFHGGSKKKKAPVPRSTQL